MASGGLITCCLGAIIGGRLAFCGGIKLRRREKDCEVDWFVLLIIIYVVGQ